MNSIVLYALLLDVSKLINLVKESDVHLGWGGEVDKEDVVLFYIRSAVTFKPKR